MSGRALLRKTPDGYGWALWEGRDNSELCVVSRALGRAVWYPYSEARNTRLGRRLTDREGKAIWHIDNGWGTWNDRQIVLRLARQMGVEA